MSSLFDPEEIAAEDERLPLRMNVDAFRLGCLDSCSAGQDLVAGSYLDLPVWLCYKLVRLGFASVSIPRAYAHSTMVDLTADPRSVNLRDRSPFFYRLMPAVCRTVRPAHAVSKLPDIVRKTLAVRAEDIMTRGGAEAPSDVSGFIDSLTNEEQLVFQKAYGQARRAAAHNRGYGSELAASGLARAVASSVGAGAGAASSSEYMAAQAAAAAVASASVGGAQPAGKGGTAQPAVSGGMLAEVAVGLDPMAAQAVRSFAARKRRRIV